MSKSKPKNGKTSSQDYVNLIYTDSDSDTIPDLNLPPLKGKKTKVKTKSRSLRNPNSQQQSVSVKKLKTVCSVGAMVKVSVAVLVFGSLVAQGVTTYLLMQQISTLQDQINELENRNAATPEEFQAVQSKLSQIDKSLSDIRTGKSGLQNLNKSIVSMQEQIASLAAAQQQQQESIQTSSSNSNDHEGVEKTVADLGSGLRSTQEDVKTLKSSQNTFTSQLEDLTNRVTVLENPPEREGVSAQANSENLRMWVTRINTTLTQAIMKAMDKLNKQQSHIEALTQFTQGLKEQVTGIQQLALSLNQSQQMMLDALFNQNSSSSDGVDLAQLQNQVNSLQQTLEEGVNFLHLMQSEDGNTTKEGSPTAVSPPPSLESLFPDLLTKHEFTLFKNEMYQDLNSLNTTVASVRGTLDIVTTDVGKLSTKVNVASSNITSLAAVVENVVTSLHSSQGVSSGQGTGSRSPNQSGNHSEADDDSTTKAPTREDAFH